MTSMLPKTEVITLCSYYSTSLQHLTSWTTLFSFTFSILLVFGTKLYPLSRMILVHPGSPLTTSIVLSGSLLSTCPPLSISLWGYPRALSWDLFSFLCTHFLLVT
ncbi:hypothetical protein FKM82_029475 [Ascaphus truei]